MALADLKKLHENRVGLPVIKDKLSRATNFDEIKASVTTLTAEVENHLQELKILSDQYATQFEINTPKIEASVTDIRELRKQVEQDKKELDEKIEQLRADIDTRLEELSEEISDGTHQFVKYSEFKSLRTAAIAIIMAIGGQVISKALAGLL